jgi:hypothetical protein
MDEIGVRDLYGHEVYRGMYRNLVKRDETFVKCQNVVI